MLYVCIEYRIQVNLYRVSAQGVDERMINVQYYYYYYYSSACFRYELGLYAVELSVPS